MDDLLAGLRSSQAYPHAAEEILVHQTHISAVFLAGDRAYKLKKPRVYPFVDYSTLELRRRFCHLEVELNRRLAPDVYLGVAPIVADPATEGGLRVGLVGEEPDTPRDWAVVMRRLRPEDNLRARLDTDDLPQGFFSDLGARLAAFHNDADRSDLSSNVGGFPTFSRLALDNLAAPGAPRDLADILPAQLKAQRSMITERARRGIPCDGHGDLRLEHFYLRDGGVDIVDCIEFNDELRLGDPANDLAFFLMDLEVRGFMEESQQALRGYRQVSHHPVPYSLLRLYKSYRSAVRGKVNDLTRNSPEVDGPRRARASEKARDHWHYALRCLRGPGELLLFAGLPATGKSTLARQAQEEGEAQVVLDSDVVRKELAGLDPLQAVPAEVGEGIYTREFSQKTYAELLRRAETALQQGHSVAVAATFVTDARRREFLTMARRLGAPFRFIEVQAPPEVALERLATRKGDPSDATEDVYAALSRAWEEPSAVVSLHHEIRPGTE